MKRPVIDLEESRQTGFKTIYIPQLGFKDRGGSATPFACVTPRSLRAVPPEVTQALLNI
jgi:hypothetical protein